MNQPSWVGWVRALVLALALALVIDSAVAQPVRCVVPAKKGGGFELTCELARAALAPAVPDLPLAYHPGGIGALVYQQVLRGTRPAGTELIAFSSGTLLNLAQGRFGRYEPERLRWVAALAMDHGVIAVHRDAPWPNLQALLAALKDNPAAIGFAAGGSIGSQDWMKAALLARAAGISHKAIRVVAFEGGGDALQALQGRHVQVLCGDAAELSLQIRAGAPVRILAVLAPQRLGGLLGDVPTALEQGVDIQWPILRGVYADARVPEAELATMRQRLNQGRERAEFKQQLQRLALLPARWDGPGLDQRVNAELQGYRELAATFGLTQARR